MGKLEPSLPPILICLELPQRQEPILYMHMLLPSRLIGSLPLLVLIFKKKDTKSLLLKSVDGTGQ